MKGASDDIGGKEMFSASDANAIGGVSNLRRLKVHRLSLGNWGKKKKLVLHSVARKHQTHCWDTRAIQWRAYTEVDNCADAGYEPKQKTLGQRVRKILESVEMLEPWNLENKDISAFVWLRRTTKPSSVNLKNLKSIDVPLLWDTQFIFKHI